MTQLYVIQFQFNPYLHPVTVQDKLSIEYQNEQIYQILILNNNTKT